MEEVILVDEKDKQIGTGEKLQVHKDGLLHRAISVFVFNNGKLLLQQRAKTKYHSPGLWSNTVCSHPRPGEETEKAAHRRLQEELGFDTELTKEFTFAYKVKFGNGLTENEFDHVFVGYYNGDIKPNPQEVAEVKWMSLKDLKKDTESNPDSYTYWLKVAIGKFFKAN